MLQLDHNSHNHLLNCAIKLGHSIWACKEHYMLMHKLYISISEHQCGVGFQKASHCLSGQPLLWVPSSRCCYSALCSSLMLVFSLSPRRASRKAWASVGWKEEGICSCLLDGEAGIRTFLCLGGSWCQGKKQSLLGDRVDTPGNKERGGMTGQALVVGQGDVPAQKTVGPLELSQLGFIGLQLNSQLKSLPERVILSAATPTPYKVVSKVRRGRMGGRGGAAVLQAVSSSLSQWPVKCQRRPETLLPGWISPSSFGFYEEPDPLCLDGAK